VNHSVDGDVRIVELHGRTDIRRFLDLPHRIYRDDPHWVAPLRREVRKLIDPKANPFFEHGEAALWLAQRGDEVVGRVSAQINRLHLEIHKDATGNFGFLEAVDDPAVFAALLGAAEAWLRRRGMRRVLGPYSPSINDEIGALIKGFGEPPMLGMAYSAPYYASRIEAAGYRKAMDVHALRWEARGEALRELDRHDRVTGRMLKDRRFRVRPIDMHRFEEEMRLAIDVYNDAWSENWGFVPATEEEVKHLIQMVRPIIIPDLVLLGEVDGQVDGIFISIPNLNEMITDLNGRLVPFGWAKLLWRLKTSPFASGRVMLAGVRKIHRQSPISTGLISWMLSETMRVLRARGFHWVELSWVLENNTRSMSLCQRAGGKLYKTYRIYEKPLDPA